MSDNGVRGEVRDYYSRSLDRLNLSTGWQGLGGTTLDFGRAAVAFRRRICAFPSHRRATTGAHKASHG